MNVVEKNFILFSPISSHPPSSLAMHPFLSLLLLGFVRTEDTSLQVLLAENAQLLSTVEIGRSVSDRPINAIVFGHPGSSRSLVVSGLRGGELEASEAVVTSIRLLVESLKSGDPETTYLFRNRQVWFVPVLNVDAANGSDPRSFLKNSRAGTCATSNSTLANGVDISRNFGALFVSGSDGCSADYAGSSAFSEPESVAIRDLVSSKSFAASISVRHHVTNETGIQVTFPSTRNDARTAALFSPTPTANLTTPSGYIDEYLSSARYITAASLWLSDSGESAGLFLLVQKMMRLTGFNPSQPIVTFGPVSSKQVENLKPQIPWVSRAKFAKLAFTNTGFADLVGKFELAIQISPPTDVVSVTLAGQVMESVQSPLAPQKFFLVRASQSQLQDSLLLVINSTNHVSHNVSDLCLFDGVPAVAVPDTRIACRCYSSGAWRFDRGDQPGLCAHSGALARTMHLQGFLAGVTWPTNSTLSTRSGFGPMTVLGSDPGGSTVRGPIATVLTIIQALALLQLIIVYLYVKCNAKRRQIYKYQTVEEDDEPTVAIRGNLSDGELSPSIVHNRRTSSASASPFAQRRMAHHSEVE